MRALCSIAATASSSRSSRCGALQEAERFLFDMEIGRGHLDGEGVGRLVELRRKDGGYDVKIRSRPSSS